MRGLDVLRRPERGRAGAHVDVRGEAAIDHRRARPDDLGERDHEQRLGVLLGERPGERRPGVIAPASVNGVATTGWPHVAISMSPSDIGPSSRSGEFEFTIVIRLGSRTSVSRSTPRVMAGDLDGVVDDGRAEREALPRLVEEGREGPVHVEVAGLDRQVGRLERAAALLVDDVEAADHADVGLEVRGVAGPSAAIEVGHERRPADRAEDEVAVPEDEVRAPGSARAARSATGRARRAPRPAPGRAGPGLPGHGRRPRARRARRRASKQIQRPAAEHLHADVSQDRQRGAVDRLDLVRGQDLQRRVGVDDAPPRQSGNAAGDSPGLRPRARATAAGAFSGRSGTPPRYGGQARGLTAACSSRSLRTTRRAIAATRFSHSGPPRSETRAGSACSAEAFGL